MSDVLSIHQVSETGAVSLVAANVPFNNLQWTRRLSKCGEFSALLACPLTVEWPGRYIVTLSGHEECGVVEKADFETGSLPTLSGRFSECLWDRFRFPVSGGRATGANWRQAVTAALSSWHMGDLPPLSMGEGTEAATGSSYALSGGAGDSAIETIYSCAAANGARPVVGYDRDADPGHLSVRIVDGLDRTRAQSDRPFWVFSLAMGTSDSVSYSGDYSCACSEVDAYAEHGQDEDLVAVERTVPVPGFDPSTMWEARAYEDVGSLVGSDVVPTAALVDQAGGLRAYDHMPDIVIDNRVSGVGYRESWDLGDLCDADVPELGLAASERVEEVREVIKPEGVTVEATLGTKQLSRIARALLGRR